MDFAEVVARRRMCRDFEDRQVDPLVVRRLIDQARRSPSAGFTQGLDFVVLTGGVTARYWDCTLPLAKRVGFRWPGLLRAPIIVVPIVDADAYVDRYGEADKAQSGLGASAAAWPVPYWFVDGGMAAMALLHAVVNEGLGALFFGIFANEPALMHELGVPDGRRAIGAIAIGHPTERERARVAAEGSPSRRPRRPLDEVIHPNGW